MIGGHKFARCLVLLAALSQGIVSGAAEAPGPAHAVSLPQIVAALQQAGLQVFPRQVEMLATVPVTRAEPQLQVVCLEPWQKKNLKARLQCQDTAACLPFYVIVHSVRPTEVVLNRRNPGRSAETQVRTSPAVRHPWMVRSGSPATLVFQDSELRASVPVICLQNGRQGDSIRVASTDRKRIYRGEVIAAGWLKGTI